MSPDNHYELRRSWDFGNSILNPNGLILLIIFWIFVEPHLTEYNYIVTIK